MGRHLGIGRRMAERDGLGHVLIRVHDVFDKDVKTINNKYRFRTSLLMECINTSKVLEVQQNILVLSNVIVCA